MNLEFSLRQRALRSQLIAWGFMLLAASSLVFSFLRLSDSYERVAAAARASGSAAESVVLTPSAVALIVCVLGYASILTAAWFIVRFANTERKIALHCSSLADALCICGNSIPDLEKAAGIMAHASGDGDLPESDRSKELAALSDLVKALR